MKYHLRAHILVFGLLMLPLIVSAQTTSIQPPYAPGVSNIPSFISTFLKAIVQIGLPVIAIFVLIAGFKFVSAGGSSGKINEARENLVYVVIGAGLIMGAWVLATLIGNTVTQVVGR